MRKLAILSAALALVGASFYGCDKKASVAEPEESVDSAYLGQVASNSYEAMDLGTLGGEHSHAWDISSRGQVVGYSKTASGEYRGFLWERGVMTDLGTLEGGYTSANAINDQGQIAGYSRTSSGSHAFLWDNGVMTDLGTLGGQTSRAYGINNRTQVVGIAQTSAGTWHAFLWEDGVVTDLGTLTGGRVSDARDINNRGQVVGYSSTSRGVHAFLWDGGVMTDLGTLDGETSYAYGINVHAHVVGDAVPPSSSNGSPCLWENGSITQLSGSWGEAMAINNRGQVAANFWGIGSAVVWEDGAVTSLGQGDVEAINNRGDVVGGSRTSSGHSHATLWRRRR